MRKQSTVFGTKEWASYNENFVNGCSHDCLYCYSKEMAIRFKRKSASTWKNEAINKDKLNAPAKRYNGRVMFPSTHDITPNNIDKTIVFLDKLLAAGNEILVVSKPHFDCIKGICQKFEIYKNQLLFRFTIGSPNSETLSFWEPFAPSFNERFKSLKYAYERGYKTSLSIEPILDCREHVELLVEKCLPFITDAIWIGKPNYLKRRMKMNGIKSKEAFQKAEQLDGWCSDEQIKLLLDKYKLNKKIKWKESIKKAMGIEMPNKIGLDI